MAVVSMSTLYHYTCGHGRYMIGAGGLLTPVCERVEQEVPWPGWFVWLTDLPEPDVDGLGLTRNYISCDRTAYRYRVTDTTGTQPWLDFIAADEGFASVAQLLLSPGAQPERWWVSRTPVPVVLDELTDLERVSRIVAARWSA